MRHLVTGGAGFIGAALANRLHRDGHSVRVIDRLTRSDSHRLHPDIRLTIDDIRDAKEVARDVRWAEVVWHLAYVQGTQTFYANPKDVISVALKGIMNVLDAAEDGGHQPELFLVSSSEVYQCPPSYPTDERVPLSVPDVTNPRYSYGGGKIASELAALAYAHAGVLGRTVIVRPHNVYGPDMGWEHVIPEFAERLANLEGDEFPIQGTGRESRSFCYIDDCVDGLMALGARGKDREVYHLGNPGEEHTITALAHQMAEFYGRVVTVVPGALPKGSPTRRLPDVSKLGALGFRPKVSLESGLVPTQTWYMNHDRAAA